MTCGAGLVLPGAAGHHGDAPHRASLGCRAAAVLGGGPAPFLMVLPSEATGISMALSARTIGPAVVAPVPIRILASRAAKASAEG
ncbi:hypothetical protein AB0903_20820 [Streptomyces sp. NPDC048389]|uniref:hypothetical protein n=1 Tax=Streptomyces sp. NPDC048389 TaxID=3154622 RepID=UPI0034522CB9